MKLQLPWRLQDVGDARNMDSLQRAAAGSKQSQSEGMAVWAGAGKTIGAGLSKRSEAHILPQCALDDGHGAPGFDACPDELQSRFGGPSLLEWRCLLYDVVSWAYVACFELYGGSQLRVCLGSHRTLGLEV